MIQARLKLVRTTLVFSTMLLSIDSIAALAQRPAIWVMDRDGAHARQLVKMEGYYWHGSPAWSPDGKSIVFDAQETGGSAAHIHIISADGREMTLRDLGPGRNPSWSKEDKIAFYSYGEHRDEIKAGVWIMNSSGGERKWLSEGQRPRWSPNGRALAFVSHHEGAPNVYVMPIDEEPRALLDKEYESINGVNWSPDGQQLVFIGKHQGTSEMGIVSVNGEATSLKVRLRGQIGWIPSWSPDGKSIVYWQRQDNGADRLHVLNAHTDDEPVLLKGQDGTRRNSDPCWSPDGTTIAFSSDRDESKSEN